MHLAVVAPVCRQLRQREVLVDGREVDGFLILPPVPHTTVLEGEALAQAYLVHTLGDGGPPGQVPDVEMAVAGVHAADVEGTVVVLVGSVSHLLLVRLGLVPCAYAVLRAVGSHHIDLTLNVGLRPFALAILGNLNEAAGQLELVVIVSLGGVELLLRLEPHDVLLGVPVAFIVVAEVLLVVAEVVGAATLVGHALLGVVPFLGHRGATGHKRYQHHSHCTDKLSNLHSCVVLASVSYVYCAAKVARNIDMAKHLRKV